MMFCSLIVSNHAVSAHDITKVEPAVVDTLIAQLGDDKFAVREDAQKKLIELAGANHELILERCLVANVKTDDPEVVYRTRAVMDLIVEKYLFMKPRPYLGVQLQAIMMRSIQGRHGSAIILSSVIEDTAAMRAGLMAGDLVFRINDLALTTDGTVDKFVNHIQSKQVGDKIKLLLVRNGVPMEIEAVLGRLPEEMAQQYYTAERKRAFMENWYNTATERIRAARQTSGHGSQ